MTQRRGRGRHRKMGQEALLNSLRVATREKGKGLSKNDANKRRFGLQPLGQYEQEFGSWEDALAASAKPADPGPSDALHDALAKAAPKPAAPKERGSSFTSYELQLINEGKTLSTIRATDIGEFVRLFGAFGAEDEAEMLSTVNDAYTRFDRNSSDMTLGFTATKGAVTLAVTAH